MKSPRINSNKKLKSPRLGLSARKQMEADPIDIEVEQPNFMFQRGSLKDVKSIDVGKVN